MLAGAIGTGAVEYLSSTISPDDRIAAHHEVAGDPRDPVSAGVPGAGTAMSLGVAAVFSLPGRRGDPRSMTIRQPPHFEPAPISGVSLRNSCASIRGA